jgi:hypothetical protein
MTKQIDTHMTLLSEYHGENNTAQTYYRPNQRDYCTIAFWGNLPIMQQYFLTEDQAQDFAEDWILK